MSLRGIVAIDRKTAARPAPRGLPENPKTLGEHIRHERMKRGLLQRDVAHILEVNIMSVTNWENNKRAVQTHHIPRVISFLNYIPDILNNFTPLKSEIFLYRCKKRITQRDMAKRIGIDVTTLHALEWRKREMTEQTKGLIDNYQQLLNLEISKP